MTTPNSTERNAKQWRWLVRSTQPDATGSDWGFMFDNSLNITHVANNSPADNALLATGYKIHAARTSNVKIELSRHVAPDIAAAAQAIGDTSARVLWLFVTPDKKPDAATMHFLETRRRKYGNINKAASSEQFISSLENFDVSGMRHTIKETYELYVDQKDKSDRIKRASVAASARVSAASGDSLNLLVQVTSPRALQRQKAEADAAVIEKTYDACTHLEDIVASASADASQAKVQYEAMRSARLAIQAAATEKTPDEAAATFVQDTVALNEAIRAEQAAFKHYCVLEAVRNTATVKAMKASERANNIAKNIYLRSPATVPANSAPATPPAAKPLPATPPPADIAPAELAPATPHDPAVPNATRRHGALAVETRSLFDRSDQIIQPGVKRTRTATTKYQVPSTNAKGKKQAKTG